MTGTVELTFPEPGVALLEIDNPPVNAFKQAVRAGLKDAFTRARDDASIHAIVLTAAGRTFMAGADITELEGSHVIMISQPQAVADVILAAVTAVAPVPTGG